MIRVSAIARRYGRVLYDIAAEKKDFATPDKNHPETPKDIFDNIATQLQEFVDLINENPTLEKSLRNPLLRGQEIVSLVKTLCKKMKFSLEITNFLTIAARKKRLSEINEILEAYKFEVSQARKQVVARITSSHELSSAYQKKLLQVLQKKTGKSIKLEITLNPSLIGGIIIHLESVIIDASLKTKLAKIQHILERVA